MCLAFEQLREEYKAEYEEKYQKDIKENEEKYQKEIIKTSVTFCQELNQSIEQTIERIMNYYNFDYSKVEELVKQYWQ
ncbi:MAG: hypothetical protein HUJ56_09100 [Erysipelotrichaceae bacterium]|nr:hypothetical protein [Erysipelotrichaceae bacterium]